jgi:hypothetical protein
MTRRRALVGAGLIAIGLVAVVARRDIHGLTLVIRAADQQGIVRRLADVDTVAIRE